MNNIAFNNINLGKQRIITTLSNNSYLEYAQGRFDSWCIYKVNEQSRYAIRDNEIFTLLKKCTNELSAKEIHQDFLSIYELTSHVFDPAILHKIKTISKKYFQHREEIEYIFSFLYAGMVAEENKTNAILKKRIKRLAIHQLLIEMMQPWVVANYSRGKKWRWIAEECKLRGF